MRPRPGAKRTYSMMNDLSALSQLPVALKYYVSQFLTGEEVARLSFVSSLFKHETTLHYFWRDKIIKAGCNQALLKKAMETGTISNYLNIYYTFFRLSSSQVSCIQELWELLCLSGDIKAIDYAIQQEKINETTVNFWNENVLQVVASSGNAAAIDYIIAKIPNVEPLAKPKDGWSLPLCAAYSGNVAVINRVAQFPGIDFKHKTFYGNDVLQQAVMSQNPDAVLFLRQLSIERNLGLDPKMEDDDGNDAFWHAEKSVSAFMIAKMKRALEMPIEVTPVVTNDDCQLKPGKR